MATLTKKGALAVTKDLDRLANLMTAEAATLGIPERIAADFASKCDKLADHIERKAGVDPQAKQAADWNPGQIGDQKGGPLENGGDSWLSSEFTQQENHELQDQAAKLAAANALAEMAGAVGKTANTFATSNRVLADALVRLARGVQATQGGVLNGTSSLVKAARLFKAAEAVLAGAASVKAENTLSYAKSAAEAIKLAEDEEEAPPAEDKPEDAKEGGKKASHGYDLAAQ